MLRPCASAPSRGRSARYRTRLPRFPGRPPHTRRGLLRGAIIYGVDLPAATLAAQAGKHAGRALIGPTYERVGTSAMAHEFGGKYRRERYPKRSFMGPALEKVAPRLAGFWAGSVK